MSESSHCCNTNNRTQYSHPLSLQKPRFYRGIAVEAYSLISHLDTITKIMWPALQAEEDKVTWLQPPKQAPLLLSKELRPSRQHTSNTAQVLLGYTRSLEHTAETGFWRGNYVTIIGFNKNTTTLFSPKRNSSTLYPGENLQIHCSDCDCLCRELDFWLSNHMPASTGKNVTMLIRPWSPQASSLQRLLGCPAGLRSYQTQVKFRCTQTSRGNSYSSQVESIVK